MGKVPAKEKPNIPAMVMATLTVTTTPVPKRRLIRSERRLEMMVQAEMIMVTIPAALIGIPISWYISGQAEPSRESGSPRLMNAR